MATTFINSFLNVFQKSDINKANLSKNDIDDIVQRLKKNISSYFFHSDLELSAKLKNVSSIDLENILNIFFTNMINEDHISNPKEFLDRLSNIIPLEKLQDHIKILNEAKKMFEEAKIYLHTSKKDISNVLKAKIISLLDSLIATIENFITAFGIGDFFRSSDSSMQTEHSSYKIFTLIYLSSSISAVLIPLLGAELGAMVVGGFILFLTTLSIIWPYIKPMPRHLPHAENFSKDVRYKKDFVDARKESLDEIANILKMGRHVILVGKSRVGKSLTAKAFAKAIERGDYPEFKGKKVFRINTTDLIDKESRFTGGNEILSEISAVMGRHRNDIILVLDEIQSACKEDVKIADQLKTFLDEGGDFPHVIGITTDIEYQKEIKNNHAFSLRFEKININDTSKYETLSILSNTLLKDSSKPLIDDDALEEIYKNSLKTKNAIQPNAAITILKKCATLTQRSQKTKNEKKLANISIKLFSLRSQIAAGCKRKMDALQEIDKLEEEMKKLKEVLTLEKKDLDSLNRSKKLFDESTLKTYLAALKIQKCDQNHLFPKDVKELDLFLLHKFLNDKLQSHIKQKSKELGVNMVIDKALVDEVTKSL